MSTTAMETRRAAANPYGYGKSIAHGKSDTTDRAFGTNLTNRTTSIVSAAATSAAEPSIVSGVPRLSLAAEPAIAKDHKAAKALVHEISIPDVEISSSAQDRADPQQVVEYLPDILQFFLTTEAKYMPVGYLDAGGVNHRTLSSHTRSTVVDWIVNVHKKFKLKQATLFLAINIMDRFLGTRQAAKDKLQLIAATCLLIASKFEDQWAPLVRDLVYVGSRSFTASDVRTMEQSVLNALHFEISCPTIFPFLSRAAKISQLDGVHAHLPAYIAEVAMHNWEVMKHAPSVIAASSVALAMQMARRHWSSSCVTETGYSEADLIPCMREINSVLKDLPAEVKTVRNKYTGSAMGNASTVRTVEV